MKTFFEHIKEIVALYWVVISSAAIMYIIYVFGYKTEILTLMIGYIVGTLQNIIGTYFSAIPTKKPTDQTTTADISANITTTKNE